MPRRRGSMAEELVDGDQVWLPLSAVIPVLGIAEGEAVGAARSGRLEVKEHADGEWFVSRRSILTYVSDGARPLSDADMAGPLGGLALDQFAELFGFGPDFDLDAYEWEQAQRVYRKAFGGGDA